MTRLYEPQSGYFGVNVDFPEARPSPSILPLNSKTLWRIAKTVFACIIFFMVAGLLFHSLRKPSYSASTALILDRRDLQLNQTNSTLVNTALTALDMDSQVEVATSRNVSARALELSAPLSETDFLPPPGWYHTLLQAAGFPEEDAPTPEQRRQNAIAEFQRRLAVRKVGNTFTIKIAASFDTPAGAARMASAVTEAYLEDQARARAEASDATSAWLRNSLNRTGITARVISNAVPPLHPDGPSLAIILVACLMAGLGTGIVLAVMRDYLGGRVSTSEEARYVTKAEWLGALPYVRFKRRKNHRKTSAQSPTGRMITQGSAHRPIDPQSVYAKTLNGVCMAMLGEGKASRSMGITSFVPAEGKSTVAVSLAHIASANGQRTLLVDAACNNADLSKSLTPSASTGLAQVLSGQTNLDDAIWTDEETGFHFLPLLNDEKRFALAWLWAKLSDTLPVLSKAYDIVIVDLAHIGETASFLGASRTLDGILFVIESDRVGLSAAERMLSEAGQSSKLYRGVILNKVRAH